MSINKNQFIVWGLDAGERAAKTFAQSLGSLLIANETNLLRVPWETDLGIAGGAMLLSILSNLKSLPWFSLDAKGNIQLVADEPTVISEAPTPPAA